MRKGFTLAETLITMAVIGIIMALSIPAVIQSTNDTKPLFKKAYNDVTTIVSDLVNNTALYPSGDLSLPASASFCTNFFSELNTIGAVSTACAAGTGGAATTFPSGVPTGTAADAIGTNAMIWYNLHPTSSFTPNSSTVDPAFTTGNCNGGAGGGGTTGIDTNVNTCVQLLVDVNGANKGANLQTDQANKDIFTIYVTNTGKVLVESAATQVYNEAYLLQN